MNNVLVLFPLIVLILAVTSSVLTTNHAEIIKTYGQICGKINLLSLLNITLILFSASILLKASRNSLQTLF